MICNKCNKECNDDKTHYNSIKEGMCFKCTFWTEITEEYNIQKTFVVDGIAYTPAKRNNIKTRWNGYAGREFLIKTLSGNLIDTNNLWHRGTVPEHFKDVLKDNATFLPVN